MSVVNESSYVDLLENETCANMAETDSTSTATVFNGQPNLQFLESRVAQIVQLNPWLDGRLVKIKGKICLRLPGKIEKKSKRFQVVENAGFSGTDVEVPTFSSHLAKYCVKKGHSVVGKDEPLFRVAVVILSSNRFVISMSLSHVIADGHSYYQIYNMLSQASSPAALVFERKPDEAAKGVALCNEEEEFFKTMGVMFNIIGNAIFSGKRSMEIRSVHNDWIDQQKEQFKQTLNNNNGAVQGPTYVSTNDIFTSHYFTEAKADLGLMVLNFRNRIEGLADNLCGNYSNVIAFQKGDYESPELIRHAVSNSEWKRKNKDKKLIPGFFAKRKCRLGIITNWSSFYHQITLDRAEHVIHFPLFEPNQPFVIDVAIIFKSSDTNYALMVIARKGSKIVDNLVAKGMCADGFR